MSSTTSDSENIKMILNTIFSREMLLKSKAQVETLSHEVGAIRADVPYEDEPLADESWLEQYNRELRENEEKERELLRRLEGSVLLEAW